MMTVLNVIQSLQLLLAGFFVGGCVLYAARVFARRSQEQPRETSYHQTYPQPGDEFALSPAPGADSESGFERHIVLVSQIADMARSAPTHVAAVLKSWLHDEQRLRFAGLCVKALGIESAKLVAKQLHSKDMAKLGVIMSDRAVVHASPADTLEALDELHAALISYEFMQGTSDWGFLGRLSDEGLTALLRSEDLQGIALILFHLPTSRAARIYGLLDERTKHHVIEALFRLEQQEASLTAAMAERVKAKSEQVLSAPQGAVSGTASWLAIVGAQLTEKDRRVLLGGAQVAADVATIGDLRAKLFSFTDAAVLPAETLKEILGAFKPAEVAILVGSLQDGSPALAAVLNALSKQLREIVLEEAPLRRQALTRPQTRQRAIHDMRVLRTRFEEIVKGMHARGELSLSQLLGSEFKIAA